MANSKIEIMKKTIQFMLMLFLTIGTYCSTWAQKKPFYNTQEEVIEAAYLTLDDWMSSGALKESIEKGLEKATGYTTLEGNYIFDLTIRHKGEVASVFKVESDAPVKMQNYVKNYMKELQFPFKMPKDKSYKFRYEFL